MLPSFMSYDTNYKRNSFTTNFYILSFSSIINSVNTFNKDIRYTNAINKAHLELRL